MRKSNLLVEPSQAPSRPGRITGNGMKNPMLDLRRRRAVALMPTVRRVEGGFRVASSTREISYLVTQPNGHLLCTCADYQRHQDRPGFQCKHVIAVDMAQKEGRLSGAGNGHPSPEPIKVQASNGLSILHRYLPNEDPVRIKLIKNTKGYSWEISVAEKDPVQALDRLKELEAQVKDQFGEE